VRHLAIGLIAAGITIVILAAFLWANEAVKRRNDRKIAAAENAPAPRPWLRDIPPSSAEEVRQFLRAAEPHLTEDKHRGNQ
jgi:hypothetical protein